MNRLEWPDAWIQLAQRISWALAGAVVLALALGWQSFFLLIPAVGAVTSFLFARRMERVPMLAVENGELHCHISTGGAGGGGGGGRLFKTYRYALADLERIEEHVFPYGNGRARSKFVLVRKQEEPSRMSKMFGPPEIWLIPQPLDERMREKMRQFLAQHAPGGAVEERIMDKPPWKK